MFINSIPQYIQGVKNVKIDLTTTDQETLYTVPSDADFNATIVNSILVVNTSSSASTIEIVLVGDGLDGSGSVSSHTFNFVRQTSVAALTTVEFLTRDLVLNAGEVVKVTAGHADRLHIILSIQELSKTRVTTSAISRI
tara:strand:- start:422 stop:838 length:417 start_codon:yes stop_codon:yes gene_type:complete